MEAVLDPCKNCLKALDYNGWAKATHHKKNEILRVFLSINFIKISSRFSDDCLYTQSKVFLKATTRTNGPRFHIKRDEEQIGSALAAGLIAQRTQGCCTSITETETEEIIAPPISKCSVFYVTRRSHFMAPCILVQQQKTNLSN